MRIAIRDASRMIIGYIDEESNGDKTVRDYSLRILGYYRRSDDTTRDYSLRIRFYGDMSAALLVMRQSYIFSIYQKPIALDGFILFY